MYQSLGENTLALHIRAEGLESPKREYRFHPTRKWRFDFAWPEYFLAVEIDGVVYHGGGGRHQRAVGFANDCDKMNAAVLLGWRVLRFTPQQVKSGQAIDTIKEVMKK